MRRLLVSFAILLAVVALAHPAAARADRTWTVRDRVGHARGTVVLHFFGYGHCYSTTGREVGVLDSGSGEAGGIVGHAPSSAHPYGWAVGFVHGGRYTDYKSHGVVGKATRAGSVWVLRRFTRGVWRKHGTVSGKCPNYMAAAALRLLVWK